MAEYKAQTPEEHFAMQRSTDAAELVSAVAEARAKGAEANRSANERFYNSLALFSGGTVALSITYLGYLKTLSKPIVHQRWLVASWIALIVCVACSIFWSFVYGYYSHYFRDREYAEATKGKYETDAKEIINFRNISNFRTQADFDAYRKPRLEAASILDRKAKDAARFENIYQHMWRWMGRIAHLGFLVGLAMLLAFAITNM